MSKNSRLTGAGGNIFAADNITVGDNEVYYQKVKLTLGADGSDEGTVSTVTGFPVAPVAITSSVLSNVAASATSVTLQAANTDRKDLILFNDSVSRCLVSLNATASATNCSFPIAAGQTVSLSGLFGNIYTGIVTGIWDSAVGAMRLTELS